MQLEHSFTVPVGIDDAWRILLDIERIGPCMPGATIESVDGDDFTGSVKVKLGPINLTYKGKASFLEKDEAAHRAVIEARGRDARGNGTASAKVTANLSESGGATNVAVQTDLDITGKPAQFGRGVMVDVGNKLIGQFANCLADTISGGGTTPEPAPAAAPAAPGAAAATPAGESAPATTAAPTAAAPAASESVAEVAAAGATPSANGRGEAKPAAEAEPIDLLQSAGPAVAKRLAPVVAAVLAAIVVFLIVRRRRG
ncbi:MAG TPA: SRPBCC family protein [Jatrophihabitans sp.]|nr:SRPBCC family protein [Jatrophihabitans sp.]